MASAFTVFASIKCFDRETEATCICHPTKLKTQTALKNTLCFVPLRAIVPERANWKRLFCSSQSYWQCQPLQQKCMQSYPGLGNRGYHLLPVQNHCCTFSLFFLAQRSAKPQMPSLSWFGYAGPHLPSSPLLHTYFPTLPQKQTYCPRGRLCVCGS